MKLWIHPILIVSLLFVFRQCGTTDKSIVYTSQVSSGAPAAEEAVKVEKEEEKEPEGKKEVVSVKERSPAAGRPQKIKAPPIPGTVTFAGEPVPLYRDDVREALEYEVTLNTFLHSKTINLIKRFERWRPMIEQVLEEHQVPRDFIYVAVAESDLVNTAHSPVGAVGMWQFMEGTAKEYNLRVDKYVDMRRDPKLSSEAAAKYFLRSYSIVKNWTLAAASFNRGLRGITRLMKKQQADNFFDLHMNEETARYIYRVLAFKLILENPEAYGYFIKPEEKYSPYEFEVLQITADIDNLVDFAIDHGTTYKELRILNPWFNNTSSYKLKVPREEIYELRLPVEMIIEITPERKQGLKGKEMEILSLDRKGNTSVRIISELDQISSSPL